MTEILSRIARGQQAAERCRRLIEQQEEQIRRHDEALLRLLAFCETLGATGRRIRCRSSGVTAIGPDGPLLAWALPR